MDILYVNIYRGLQYQTTLHPLRTLRSSAGTGGRESEQYMTFATA